ncbi:hypothetical protein N0V93_010042 [Gnomoniopsis smithogilvyi]|uniref:Uncharacterized protein n=1 Tax=Gnomoniopsis smithogilvyi TaxID=1191159 RepID=A0A9W9CRZ0_9PEZI|nr:hypothetical protein N0V93_010042 [Gnomoniopsis smithogilvyi]
MLDVSALVHQMHDTLSQIHETITSLDTKQHDEKLDALEAQRDSVLEQLHATFQKQFEELDQKRKSERDEITEKRRKEDEEIAARRKKEDEELQTRDQSEDSEREKKLEEEKKGVETETDNKMEEIETEAQRLLDEGHKKISELEQKRREINSLIDEQMKAPLPPPPKRRRGTRSAPAQSAPTEPAPPVQKEASREIEPQESAPPVESTTVESAPAESAPAESTPAESAPVESAAATEPEQDSREIVPETTTTEETVPEKAEEPVPEPAPQADSAPEEASAQSVAQDKEEIEEAKPESGATDQASAQEDQPQENLAKDEPKVPEGAGESKEATNDEPGHREEPTRELQETAKTGEPEQVKVEDQSPEPESNTAESARDIKETTESGEPEQDKVEEQSAKPEPTTAEPAQETKETTKAEEPEQDKVEDQSPEPESNTAESSRELQETTETAKPDQDKMEDHTAEPESNTAEEHTGDRDLVHAEEDKNATEPSEHQENAAQEPLQETKDAEESKPEVIEDNDIKADSHNSDNQAEGNVAQDEKTADESSASQDEPPQEVPSEPTESKQDASVEHGASVPSEPAQDVSHQEQQPATQSQPAEDLSSAPETNTVPAQEEASEHRDLSSEGITKGGAAEEYLKMADAEPESQHEESAPVGGAADKSEAERSSVPEQPKSQEDTSTAKPSESRDMTDAGGGEKGDDSSAPAHDDQSPQAKPEETPASTHAETENAPSETHDANNKSEVVEDNVDSSASVPEDKPSEAKVEETSLPAEAERDIAPTETHEGDKLDDVKVDDNSSAPVEDAKDSAHEPSSEKHVEKPSDAHEETTTAEPQPETDSGASKSEDHEADDSAAQDTVHDQTPSEHISQDHQDGPVSKEVDLPTDSSGQREADSESGKEHEAEPRSADTNEAQPEAEPVEDTTTADSHDDAFSPKDNEEKSHPTEQSAEVQSLEQKDVPADDDDHREESQVEPSLGLENEPKDHDAHNSRDLEGETEQKDPEHNEDHAEHQALGDSAQPVDEGHPSADQPTISAPNTSDGSGSQQPETTEEVLEGSGNDQAPSRGLDVKDSESHPAEENFDLSGNEPIPGTMTHGIDPESADKTTKDGELGEKTTDRDLDTEVSSEKPSAASSDHAVVENATDSQEGTAHGDVHDADIGEHGAMDNVSMHQPADDEAQVSKSIDTVEPEEHPSSSLPTSHEQDPAPAEEQDPSDKPEEVSEETLANSTQTATADHPTEAEKAPQDTLADKGHNSDLKEERTTVEESEKSSEHEAPEISVTEHTADDNPHPEGLKPTEGADESSSRDLNQTGHDAERAGKPEEAWEDRHSSADARRPSTILTDNVHPDDDADAGLFAVPPTPRDEIDQQKPASLQASSTPPQIAVGHDEHDASASLPNKAEAPDDIAHGAESYAHEHEAGKERNATEDHVEEDRSSLPPWLAQNGHSEELPQLQTGSVTRDIYAHDISPAHSRDGSYHEDFKLIPVAYTPVDKKSRSVESFQDQAAEDGLADNHDKQVSGHADPELSSAQVEEHDGSHQGLSQPDELHETNKEHVDLEPQHPAEQSSTLGSDEQMKEQQAYEPSRSIPQEQQPPSTEDLHEQSLAGPYRRDIHKDVPHVQQPNPFTSGVNYDGEGYGPSPTEEHHYDAGATAFPQSGHSEYSPGLTGASQSATRSSFSGHDTAAFSYSDDRTETESHTVDTPTVATSFDKDQSHERAETPEQFHHALGNLPDESVHTVQGTDDLFDDDDDDDASDYGEAIVEAPEKIVYQANGSHENVALGGNHSSLSLGRNSMASQGSYGHRSAGSRSSFGSVRETTPLRVAEGTYLATSPNIVRADWAADYEDELRQPSRATPQLQPSTANDTPGISPFALRNTPAGGALGEDDRGLAASRWSPRAARPQTPPSNMRQAVADSPQTPGSGARLGSNNPFRAQQNDDAEEIDPSLYMPRDVTNTPWHARNDSVPMSLHSQTTLSSAQDSPIHSSLAVDKHEPVIRDSWPAPAPGYQQYLSSWGGRPRGDSSLSSNNGEYDPFKADSNGSGNVNKSSIYNPFQQRGRAESSVSAAPSVAPSAASASPSRGSGLFHKMRSVFEQGGSGAGEAPSLTRPVSGTYHAVSPLRSPAHPEQATRRSEEQDYSNRSGVSDLRGDGSVALSPTVRKVVEVVDLRAESANDTQSERKVSVAEGQVSSKFTITPEVEPGSDFRLAWLRVEGWRAELRKAGDIVERARWEWKLDDLMAESRARRASIPDIVAGFPSSMKGSMKSGGNRNAASRSLYSSGKSVRWRDRTK